MTIVTVGDLIAALENYDPETPVMIGHQPSWPLAETVAGVVGPDDRETCHLADHEECDLEDGYHVDDEGPETVWLVAGGHAWDRSPYAPRAIFDGEL